MERAPNKFAPADATHGLARQTLIVRHSAMKRSRLDSRVGRGDRDV
jgi:hypothetical protein